MRKRSVMVLSSVAVMLSLFSGSDAEAKRRDKVKKGIVFRGIISAMSPDAVVVNGRTVLLKATTKYEDFVGTPVTLAAFSVGDCVKVKLALGQQSDVAREMELEDECLRSPATPPPTVTPDGTSAPTATTTPGATPTSGATPTVRATPDHDDDSSDDRISDDDDNSSGGRGRGRGRNRGRDHAEDNRRGR